MLKLLIEKLDLAISHSVIDKCHRYGRSIMNRPRPIIVRLAKISTRDLILQNAKKLRQTRDANTANVYINEDLPPQIKKERAALRAIVTHVRHVEPHVNARVTVDTLHISNESYKYEDIDLLPSKYSLQSARTPRVADNVIGFASEYSPLSNFYPCSILIQGQTWVSTEQYYQHGKCQVAQNDRAANLILRETDSLRIKRLGDKVAVKSETGGPSYA